MIKYFLPGLKLLNSKPLIALIAIGLSAGSSAITFLPIHNYMKGALQYFWLLIFALYSLSMPALWEMGKALTFKKGIKLIVQNAKRGLVQSIVMGFLVVGAIFSLFMIVGLVTQQPEAVVVNPWSPQSLFILAILSLFTALTFMSPIFFSIEKTSVISSFVFSYRYLIKHTQLLLFILINVVATGLISSAVRDHRPLAFIIFAIVDYFQFWVLAVCLLFYKDHKKEKI